MRTNVPFSTFPAQQYLKLVSSHELANAVVGRLDASDPQFAKAWLAVLDDYRAVMAACNAALESPNLTARSNAEARAIMALAHPAWLDLNDFLPFHEDAEYVADLRTRASARIALESHQ